MEPHKTTTIQLRRLFVAAAPLALGLLALSWSPQAEAAVCNSKPAVCQRLKMQEAKEAKAPAPATTAKVQAAPVKRCDSKPAVCQRLAMRDAQAGAQVAVATKPAREPGFRCDTKLAVCYMEKSAARN